MRQMQQQLGPLGGNVNSQASTQTAFGTLQNGLNNLNTNALMNALQGSPAPGQSGQQPGPTPIFENAILAAIAAANNQQAASNGTGMNFGVGMPDSQPNQQQQQHQQQQQQQMSQPLSQPSAAFGLDGLDQLRDFNPLSQQVINSQQNNSSGFSDFRRQSLGGFGGLGQQLANELQQQVQQQQQQQPQHVAMQQQHQQQQNQMLQQQNPFNQQNQPQQAQFQQQNQLGMPWMGQNVNMNVNPTSFGDNAFLNPSAGKNPALSLTNNMTTFGDQGNTLSQDFFGAPLQPQNNSQTAGMLGVGVGASTFAGMQFQPAPAKRRSSSISSGSLSPIGKQKNLVSNVSSSNQPSSSSFSHLFPPSFSMTGPLNNIQSEPMANKQSRRVVKKRAKTFPEKLMHAMMENSDEEAVAWLPDGKSFVIVNPDLFCDEVLNKVFKESKYASFVRKLHRWGFVRLTSGTGTDCFHHPFFQRNRQELAAKITCTPRGEKEKPERPTEKNERGQKPPSLAGVEKFIRAKVVAAASAAANAEEALLLKQEDDDDEDDDDPEI